MASRSQWYREPWPWLLMAGPAAVVLAGAVTSFLAFKGADGLVADDYYKQGLMINRAIARDTAARKLGLRGVVDFEPGRIHASLSANRALGESIRLTLVAPRAGGDRVATLTREANGDYAAKFGPLAEGRWTLVLETAEWRLEAPADLRSIPSVEIDARN